MYIAQRVSKGTLDNGTKRIYNKTKKIFEQTKAFNRYIVIATTRCYRLSGFAASQGVKSSLNVRKVRSDVVVLLNTHETFDDLSVHSSRSRPVRSAQ